jgi:hypothetical protein
MTLSAKIAGKQKINLKAPEGSIVPSNVSKTTLLKKGHRCGCLERRSFQINY